jgi:2-phosphosulfolactate phosphatase
MVAVSATEDSILFRERGYLLAGERNGFKLEGFDFGNSPQEFTPERVGGASIVITTTNGTQALVMSNAADRIWVSSFYNLSATVEAILEQGLPVVLFCAGWKNRFNLEDSLFAGAMIDQLLQRGYAIEDDASRAALSMFKDSGGDFVSYLEDANHVQRFKSMHAESDLDVCLRTDVSNYAVKAEIREFLLSDNKVYAGELVQYVPGSVNLQ